MAPSVKGGALFTGCGAGSGGVLGVGLIYGGTIYGAVVTIGGGLIWHFISPSTTDLTCARGDCGPEVGKWLNGNRRKRVWGA